VQVDILDGLIVALDLLFRRTENKKCERKLMVITDAAAKITDPTDIEAVVQMITSMEVKLQVMCVPLFQSRLCTSN
jgi:ATP-dependent DNA helicase 2 subunit 2